MSRQEDAAGAVRYLCNLAVCLLALAGVCALRPPATSRAQVFPVGALHPTHTITPGAISSIVKDGGTVVLQSWGGLDGNPQLNVNVGGTWVQGSTSVVQTFGFSSTFGALPAGTYPILVVDYDGSWYFDQGGLTVTTSSTPGSIYAGAVRADYIATNARCSGSPCTNGGTVTGWLDATSLHQDLTCTGGVTYMTNDAGYIMPGIASVVFDGTSGYCHLATFALASTTNVSILGAFYIPASGGGSSHTMVNIHGANDTNMSYDIVNRLATIVAGSAPGAAVSTPTINGTCSIDLSANAFAGSTNSSMAAVDNLTPVTTSASGAAWTSTSDLYVGANYLGTSAWTAMHVAEFFIINTASTTGASSQFMSAVQYFNGAYGCTPFPTLASNTGGQTSNSSCGIAFQGTNFAAGMIISLGGGIGALTINVMDSTYAEATLPSVATAGAYDATFTNPDGRAPTFVGSVHITSATNPVCIMGQYVGFWWEGANWVCSSGSGPGGACAAGDAISQLDDLSGYGTNPVQATGADQPTVHSLTDSDYGSKPSLTSVALSTMAGSTVLPSGVSATASETFLVLKQTATTGTQRADNWSTGAPTFRVGISNDGTAGAGIPSYSFNDGSTAHHANWGSALSGPSLVYGGAYGSGTITTFIDVNDDGTSPVTVTSSGTVLFYNPSTPSYMFPFNGGNGPLATIAAGLHLFAHPTTAQARALCNYFKADFSGSWTCATIARGHMMGAGFAWQAAALLGLVVGVGARRRRAANDNAENDTRRAA